MKPVKPKTLSGIKQLAKVIRREQLVKHTKALDMAARQAGYDSYVHAHTTFKEKRRNEQPR